MPPKTPHRIKNLGEELKILC
ncbi:hypothetical protein [Methanocaldococcus sp.]